MLDTQGINGLVAKFYNFLEEKRQHSFQHLR